MNEAQVRRLLVVLLTALLCMQPRAAASETQYLEIDMRSSLLSQFWGQPVFMNAHVLLPDSYYKEPQRKYPVLYWIQGFGGIGQLDMSRELMWQRPMRELHAEYIFVLLNGMFNGGHQEFADSANNGPWGAALTQEFIPLTEAHFRAIGTAQTRFVAGHSSGGWSALWLQTTYPTILGVNGPSRPIPSIFATSSVRISRAYRRRIFSKTMPGTNIR